MWLRLCVARVATSPARRKCSVWIAKRSIANWKNAARLDCWMKCDLNHGVNNSVTVLRAHRVEHLTTVPPFFYGRFIPTSDLRVWKIATLIVSIRHNFQPIWVKTPGPDFVYGCPAPVAC